MKTLAEIVGISPSEQALGIMSSFSEGMKASIDKVNPEIQVNISVIADKFPKEPYEFVGRIDGSPLTKLRSGKA